MAPTGTPKDVIRTINAAVADIIKSPQGTERILAGGAEPAGEHARSAERPLMRADHKRWSEIIRTMKIGPE